MADVECITGDFPLEDVFVESAAKIVSLARSFSGEAEEDPVVDRIKFTVLNALLAAVCLKNVSQGFGSYAEGHETDICQLNITSIATSYELHRIACSDWDNCEQADEMKEILSKYEYE